ncbi:1,5-anhydro-D-fructose reductase [Megamonas hypermegale]|uniref:1,5-anhydro-D-fructose reductase n=1 Tax=Megamonas hypermegale TaxID=158847 RepID=A0A378NRB2_9FIRM|nr:Gfo/Idh/MocA family oxidoreductase [Megamonas hypermegale]STY70934.1 1,5-anhydro-D-fructose reductase [Megamonas hypermegale]
MKQMKVGIVGTGLIASLMAKTLNGLNDENIKNYAVASRTLTKARAFADEYKIEKAYGSYMELIQDKDIDLVYIAVPHNEHYRIAKLCIENKKNVLCEKPFTVNAEETKDLLALAKENNVLITEAIWTRYMPSRKLINDVIASGIIGQVHSIQANLGYPLKDVKRMISPELAGGALLDVGVYTVNFALMVFGNDIKDIFAKAVMSDKGVDLTDSITITWNDGKMAVLHASMMTPTDRCGFIYGEKGYICVTNINNPEAIKIYDVEHNLIKEVEIPKQVTGYEYEVLACAKAIDKNELECEAMPHKETIFVMEILDKIRNQWNMKYPFEK